MSVRNDQYTQRLTGLAEQVATVAATGDVLHAAPPGRTGVEPAEAFARAIAGDDGARYIQLFYAALNLADVADRRLAAPPSFIRSIGVSAHLAATEGRARGTAAMTGGSIFTDPVFIENAKELLRDRSRIVGGVPAPEFPDCVAVGSAGSWCCSGTLIARNVVVTAGHCAAGGCAARILIGPNVKEPGEVVNVRQAIVHPHYGMGGLHNDLTVLILDKDVTSTAPRAIAPAAALSTAKTVRVVGYGNTDTMSWGGYGRRLEVDVPLASHDPAYGADRDVEFVAGAPFLDKDSCNGDSGGPAYVQYQNGWALIGATSRATDNSARPCGDGGIYVRVDKYADWIRSVPGGHWA